MEDNLSNNYDKSDISSRSKLNLSVSKYNYERKKTPLRFNTTKEFDKSLVKNREDLLKRNFSKSNIKEKKSLSNVRNISKTIKKNEKDISPDNKPRK